MIDPATSTAKRAATTSPSLLLLREVAEELGYQPDDDQLRALSEEIVDALFHVKPKVLCSSMGREYRRIAKRVLKQKLR